MAHVESFRAAAASADSAAPLPVVRHVSIADLQDALAKGLADFQAMPTHAVFLSLIYPVIGLLLGRATLGYEFLPLLYPLAAGFALIGPFAAIGLYELSRRREAGLDTSWRHAFDVFYSPSWRGILALGALLTAIFAVWVAVAHAIYVANFGYREPASLSAFATDLFTTRAGLNLIVVGNLVGFIFAMTAFAISVISFPLLLDRNVGAAAAAATSVRVVAANPGTMAVWGLIVAGLLALGSVPLFLGLAIVMPILGHASWHLYRKAVEPDPDPHPEYAPRERGRRYAAEFPVSLFTSTREPRP